eukprot:SAG31_NODE_5111_length_2735_cov_11.899848_2_plen_120_part_00
MKDFGDSLNARMDSEIEPLVVRDPGTGLWPNVFDANDRQRVLLSDVLWHLHDVSVAESTGAAPPRLAGLCVGVAGTGKTFIQRFVRMFCKRPRRWNVQEYSNPHCVCNRHEGEVNSEHL